MNNLSFIDLVKSYGEHNPPEFKLNNDSDVNINEWQEKLYSALSSLRGKLPERVAPEMKLIESIEEETHTRQLVEIPVTAISTLPAYILIPKDIKEGEKRPGIFACHGHIKLGMKTISGVEGVKEDYQAYGLNAVKSGFVVISPAWWGWPGRDGHIERVNAKRDKCNVIQFVAAMYGLSVMDLHIQDAQAALDVLCSLDQVDKNNIGCIGNSYGGRTAMWASIFDKRVKATVAAGSMNTFRERSLKLSSCALQFLPGVMRYCDVTELFCLIAPRALQLQAGAQDKLITPEDRDNMKHIVETVFEKLDSKEKFDYVLHDGGHYLKWSEAERFLKKQLI